MSGSTDLSRISHWLSQPFNFDRLSHKYRYNKYGLPIVTLKGHT